MVDKIFFKNIFTKKACVKDNTNNVRNIKQVIKKLTLCIVISFSSATLQGKSNDYQVESVLIQVGQKCLMVPENYSISVFTSIIANNTFAYTHNVFLHYSK